MCKKKKIVYVIKSAFKAKNNRFHSLMILLIFIYEKNQSSNLIFYYNIHNLFYLVVCILFIVIHKIYI